MYTTQKREQFLSLQEAVGMPTKQISFARAQHERFQLTLAWFETSYIS